jgi:hypothetical protein
MPRQYLDSDMLFVHRNGRLEAGRTDDEVVWSEGWMSERARTHMCISRQPTSVYRDEVNMGITRKRWTSSTMAAIQISKKAAGLRLQAGCKAILEHHVPRFNRHLTYRGAPLSLPSSVLHVSDRLTGEFRKAGGSPRAEGGEEAARRRSEWCQNGARRCSGRE